MTIQSYLKRINYNQPLKTDVATLFQLHQAQVYAIPFEDLNIQYNIPINLTTKDLYQKIILKNRGGFCYELNGLFNWLLTEIGFKTTLISAKVISKEGIIGPAFDHAAIIVDLEKRWLVDVGFGRDGFVLPKELKLDTIQKEGHDFYQFTASNEEEWLLSHSDDGEHFNRQYVLSFDAQKLANFKAECQRKEIDETGHFKRNYICTKATPTGRISILNDSLIIKENGEKVIKIIENEAERLRILKEIFEIPVDDLISQIK